MKSYLKIIWFNIFFKNILINKQMALRNGFANMITGNFIKFSITDIYQTHLSETFCHLSSKL